MDQDRWDGDPANKIEWIGVRGWEIELKMIELKIPIKDIKGVLRTFVDF